MSDTKPGVDEDAVRAVREMHRVKSIARWLVDVENLATFGAVAGAMEFDRFDGARCGATVGDLFGRAMKVRVGRDEDAVVIEVDLAFWVRQQQGFSDAEERELGASERVSYVEYLLAWAQEMGAAGAEVVQRETHGGALVLRDVPGPDPSCVRLMWA